MKYQVQQLGAGFLAIGGWYWCRLGPDELPSEPISTHGPFLLRCLAAADAERQTNAGSS